ncbi:MAG: prolipoprotein diacylglyceryl transferase [FCB group bacterium]|nr:prolipoprotein diacylglyceryl transferase [FCB group bacterium]
MKTQITISTSTAPPLPLIPGVKTKTAPSGDFGPIALFRGQSFTVATFGLFIGSGFFLAALHSWFYLGYVEAGLSVADLAWLSLTLSLGIPTGAYLMSRLLDLPRLFSGKVTLARFLRVPGFALWGGLLSGGLLILTVTRIAGWNTLQVFDAIVLGLPLAQAFGRIGCLNYGCCHGRECTSGPSVTYHHPESKVLRTYRHLKGIPLFPTQIYSAIANTLIYLVLISLIVFRPAAPLGLLTATYLVLYGFKRLLIEFLRGEYPRTGFLGLTIWQWFSLGFVSLGLALFFQLGPPLDHAPFSLGEGWALMNAMLPWSVVASLLVAAAYSIHGRKVGKW